MCFTNDNMLKSLTLAVHHTAYYFQPTSVSSPPAVAFSSFCPRPRSVGTASLCGQRHYTCHLAPVLEELSSAFNLMLFLNLSPLLSLILLFTRMCC